MARTTASQGDSLPQPPCEHSCHKGIYALPAILAGARQMARDGRPHQPIKPYAGGLNVLKGQ